MSTFEICKKSYLNTTTLVTVDSGTDSVYTLFDRNKTVQYSSNGKNDDTSGHTLTVEFPSSKNINRICLQNINLKGFKIYHSSNSANTLTFTSTSETTTSIWTGNSSTAMYLMFATVAATSIVIDATTTIDADEEKKIGQLWILEKRLSFERNPTARDFKAKLDSKEYVHELAGGGWARYAVGEYYSADINLKYRTMSETSNLLDIYDDRTEFVFSPFPTGTAWYNYQYQQIYECIWIRDFDFYTYQANNFLDAGTKGKLSLRETPR